MRGTIIRPTLFSTARQNNEQSPRLRSVVVHSATPPFLVLICRSRKQGAFALAVCPNRRATVKSKSLRRFTIWKFPSDFTLMLIALVLRGKNISPDVHGYYELRACAAASGAPVHGTYQLLCRCNHKQTFPLAPFQGLTFWLYCCRPSLAPAQ